MPSIIHEFLVDMFRGCPALSRELLAGCCNLHLDPAFHLRLTAAEFAELTPPEYRADAVMRIEDGQGQCQEGWITEVAFAAMEVCRTLDEERATRYADFILTCLGEEARRALEALMSSSTYQYQSEFAKSYVKQGREEGRQEGLKEGRQAMLGKWLRARFGELPGEFAARLKAADSEELDRYAERLMRATTLDDVFAAQSTGDV